MAKVAYGLVRISTSEQDLNSQKESLRSMAKKMGYEISDNHFFGEQISGYDEDDEVDRRSILELREAIGNRKPDAIFCWELSRLTRRAIKVPRYIDEFSVKPRIPWYFADYEFWTIDVKTGTPIDDNINKLYGGAIGVEKERERIVSRTKRGRDANAEKGFFVGHLKDGYIWEYNDNNNKIIVPDDDRKDVIKLIFELYGKKNYSSREVMEYLNNNHIPTTNRYRMEHPEKFKGYKDTYKDRNHNTRSRTDSLWTDGLVCGILRDKWYIGERKYNGNTYHIEEPIIDTSLWEQVQIQLKASKTISTTDTHKPYLLTGLLYCGKCGRKMYAHGDGLDNMYYCSSQEYGRTARCGLRWIRQENLDSIVLGVVKSRTYDDTTYGNKTVLSNFFSVNKSTIVEIDNKIKVYKSSIKRRIEDISKFNKQIEFLISQQIKYSNKPNLAQGYQNQLNKVQDDISTLENEITGYKIKLNSLSNEKKRLSSTRKKLGKITNLNDFEEAKKFLHTAINRIDVYNPDKKTSIIVITYVHGKVDVAIYSPTRLKKNYYLFTSSELETETKFKYDGSDCFVCRNHYIGIKANSDILIPMTMELQHSNEEQLRSGYVIYGDWDTTENRVRYKQEVQLLLEKETITRDAANNMLASYDSVKRFSSPQEMLDFYKEQGYVFYNERVPVIEYVECKRESDVLIPFNDLLPLSEKGIKRKAQVKEWYRNKYNTGKPSSTPFIVKDDTYEDIQKKRKRLYNRKNKILNNKHLSEEQKSIKLFEIKEQLDAFKYQIKYLPTNKKGIQNIEKYNSSLQDSDDE